MAKTFKPEKYGMIFCPDCKGKGKIPTNPHGLTVCSKCGGSGVIRKEDPKARTKGKTTDSDA